MDICSAGSWPEIDHNSSDSTDPNQESEPLSMEEGDRILATGLFPHTSMDIRALSTISQRLAEAHQANMKASNPVPEYLKEFTSMLSKQLFDTLPEPKEWDHAVELIPGSKLTGCKIYPSSPTEQKELDIFLKEDLKMGRIRPSKSLILSLVFFIKKKDGSLRLVQDY